MEGKSQQAAAGASGIRARSARNWQRGPVPSEKKVGEELQLRETQQPTERPVPQGVCCVALRAD